MPGDPWVPPFPLWSFREDVHLEVEDAEGAVIVHDRWADTPIPRPGAAVLAALSRMTLGPISLDNVLNTDAERRELDRILAGLQHIVVHSFGLRPAVPLVSVVPLTPMARFELSAGPLTGTVRLSRYALVRTQDGVCLVESPLSLHRVLIHHPAGVAAIAPLIHPVEAGELSYESRLLAWYLVATGMVVAAAVDGAAGGPVRAPRFSEDTDAALVGWNPVDLMFYRNSTLGRHDHDYGAVYRMGEAWSVEPVVKPPTGARSVTLPRPRWTDLLREDPPLTVAVEANRSTRRFADDALTVRELGDLLYRTARVRSLTGSSNDMPVTLGSDRPYPSSGDAYELELYVIVDRCADLDRGVYHYDPYGHRLEHVDADPADIDRLLRTGAATAGPDGLPPVLLTLTARFRRLSWKYNGLSFLMVCKNVGVLTQSISLVATAMGLATGVIDSGDLELTSRVLRLDWRVESIVGGLAVGRSAAGDDVPAGEITVNDADWRSRARGLSP
jgi:SagB-type dehydrogenase family enzyme